MSRGLVCPACRLVSAALACGCRDGVRLDLAQAGDRATLMALVAADGPTRVHPVAVVVDGPRVVGRITSAGGAVAPVSGVACAAYAIELRTRWPHGEVVTLRLGHSAGLAIALSSGARLELAPGPLWVAEPELTRLATPWLLEEALRTVDPHRAPAVELTSPIPFHAVAEACVHVGDGIEVVGALRAGDGAAPLATAGAYRTVAVPMAYPTQLPVLIRWPTTA